MERTIKIQDVKNVVADAYSKFKNEQCGAEDSRVSDANPDDFAITVMLTDGTVVEAGDVDKAFAMGNIAKVPVYTTLFSQNESAKEVMEKLNGGCGCNSKGCPSTPKPHHLPVNRRGVRAVSIIEPTGDSDGKFDIISSMMVGLAGDSPVLDDNLYKRLTADNQAANVENRLAESEFVLYDNAQIAIDLYTRLTAMRATTRQLAEMGATIAAGGRNPETGNELFDSSVSRRVVAAIAAKGMHKMSMQWLVVSGVPAQAGFGGGVLGVVPGVLGIAAYSPKVNGKGVSPKAAHAVAYIANQLGVNAFSGESVKFEK